MEGDPAQMVVGEELEEVSWAGAKVVAAAAGYSDGKSVTASNANGTVDLPSSRALRGAVNFTSPPMGDTTMSMKGSSACTKATRNGYDGLSDRMQQGAPSSNNNKKKKKGKKKKGAGGGGAAAGAPSGPTVAGTSGGDAHEGGDGEFETDVMSLSRRSPWIPPAGGCSSTCEEPPLSASRAGGSGAAEAGGAGAPAQIVAADALAGTSVSNEEEFIRALRSKELERRKAKAGAGVIEHK